MTPNPFHTRFSAGLKPRSSPDYASIFVSTSFPSHLLIINRLSPTSSIVTYRHDSQPIRLTNTAGIDTLIVYKSCFTFRFHIDIIVSRNSLALFLTPPGFICQELFFREGAPPFFIPRGGRNAGEYRCNVTEVHKSCTVYIYKVKYRGLGRKRASIQPAARVSFPAALPALNLCSTLRLQKTFPPQSPAGGSAPKGKRRNRANQGKSIVFTDETRNYVYSQTNHIRKNSGKTWKIPGFYGYSIEDLRPGLCKSLKL